MPVEKRIQQYADAMVEGCPFAQFLGMKLIEVTQKTARLSIDFRSDLIGDTKRNVLHGGVITTLLDHVSGLAAFAALGAEMSVVTLDLRIDYMRAAHPECQITGEAYCYKTSPHIAFVRAKAHDNYQGNQEAIALAQSAFMVRAL